MKGNVSTIISGNFHFGREVGQFCISWGGGGGGGGSADMLGGTSCL